MSGSQPRLPENTHITVDENGMYSWRGTINPQENPTIAYHIAKVMGVVLALSAAVFVGVGVFGHFRARELQLMISVTAPILLIVAGISAIVTMVYVHVLGTSYSADYVMDETGLLFRPAPEQQELNKNIATGTALLSLLAGKSGSPAGNLATLNSDAVSVFKRVFRVKGIRKHCCIKVSSPLLYNQVYVAPEDYDFVYQFVASHCPQAWCSEV